MHLNLSNYEKLIQSYRGKVVLSSPPPRTQDLCNINVCTLISKSHETVLLVPQIPIPSTVASLISRLRNLHSLTRVPRIKRRLVTSHCYIYNLRNRNSYEVSASQVEFSGI